MKIFKAVNRVPGGLMVVPLFIGMVLNTFFPNLLKIGGFTQALTGTGYPTVLGMYLFTVGTKMTFRAAPRMLLRGLGMLTRQGRHGHALRARRGQLFDGNMLGLSTLAVMVAMSDTNGGMFLALTSVMGDKEDSGTYVVQSIETGPVSDDADFRGRRAGRDSLADDGVGDCADYRGRDARQPGRRHPGVLRIARADHRAVHGLHARTDDQSEVGRHRRRPGVVLGLTVVVVTGFVCIMADRLLGGIGIAGAAASSTAGNSAAVPQAVAMADTTYVPVAEAATVQVAASVIVTAILTPLLTSWWFKRVSRGKRRGRRPRAS